VGRCWNMAKSPGVAVRRDHHLIGDPVRRPGPRGWGIAGRSALQCCNRLRHPAGQQPQSLPSGARSDPVGVLLDYGQVPRCGGAPGSSPGGARSGPVEHAAGRCISLDVAVRQ
jgi:hypothetical protein